MAEESCAKVAAKFTLVKILGGDRGLKVDPLEFEGDWAKTGPNDTQERRATLVGKPLGLIP